MKYLVIIEKAGNNYSAYLPDVPGCIATGRSKEEARQNVLEALELHLQGLMDDNLPIPEPVSEADYVNAM